MRILSTSPSRLGLLGGGTDIESYANEYGGFCINMAINIRSRVFLTTDSSGIFNQYPTDANPKLFDIILNYCGKHDMHVISSFDGHIGCGLGSSASSSTALLSAILKSRNLIVNPHYVAVQAYELEVRKLKWAGGKQDQFASAYGGMNGWKFTSDGFQQIPFPQTSINYFYPYLLLVYIGGGHKNHIQEEFNKLTKEQIQILSSMKEIAIEGVDAFFKHDIKRIAELMQASWSLKKASNKAVSNERIDAIYSQALKEGAIAGKLLGAGGGGYMLFLVPPDKRKYLLEKLEFKEVDFMPSLQGIDVRIL